MDLVAGNLRELLLAISIEDVDGLPRAGPVDAHLPLGTRLDHGWLDELSAAIRAVTGSGEPADFSAMCWPLDGPGEIGDRTVEQVDAAWVAAVARVADQQLDAVAGRWIDLVGARLGPIAAEEKPAFREIAGRLVTFAREAQASPAVLLAWSL